MKGNLFSKEHLCFLLSRWRTLPMAFLIPLLTCNLVMAQTITIGTGTENSNGNGSDPVDDYYKSMHYQTVYTAAELTSAGLTPYDELTGLGFSVTESPGTLANYTIKIGHTSATNAIAHVGTFMTTVRAAADYVPTVTAEGVYDMLAFNTNFVWNGTDNIVIDICTGPSNPYASPYGGVRIHSMTNGSRSVRSDSADQCSVNTTSLNTNRPNIQFSYTDGVPPACAPPSGLTAVTTVNSASLSWTSDGSLFDIEWGASGFTQGTGTMIDNTSSNPYNLTGLAGATAYEFYVRNDCGVDGTSTWTGPYSFATKIPGQIGEGASTTSYFPIYSGYGYNYSQQIYLASELDGALEDGSTYITKIRFKQVSMGTQTNYNNWTVYMGNTSKSVFSGTTDWVPAAQLTQVYSGVLTFAANSWVEIVLSTPFEWNGTDNLVVAVDENTSGYSSSSFASFASGSNRGILYYSDTTNPNPSSPPTANYGPNANIAQIQIVASVPPSCSSPTALSHTQLSLESAELSWSSDGSLFEVKWDEAGFDVETEGFTISGITETSVEAPGLTMDVDYEFYVRRDCGGGDLSGWAGPYSFSVGYCDSVPTSHDNSGITNVTVGDVSFPVASVNYYEYTDNVANIAAGTDISSSVTFLTDYTYNAHIWIDLNDDGIFDNATEKVYSGESLDLGPTTPSVLDTTFPLPVDAAQGIHKMRIGTADSGQATPNPCYSESYGVTVDLTVNITEPPSCVAPSGVILENVTAYEADVNWDVIDNAQGYTWFVFDDGADRDTDTPVATGSVTEASVLIAGLTPETDYDFYVKTDCGIEDGESMFSTLLNFTTEIACPAPTDLEATQLSVSSAELGWVSDGTLFELKWGNADFDLETEGTLIDDITETLYVLEGLDTDTEYEFYVRRDCSATGDGFSMWTGPYSFSVGYCDSVPTSHDNSGITNVTVGDVSFPVASVNYYEYTDNIANIAAGTSITSSVTFLTSYTYDTHIWIDLNDDGIFDNATEKVYSGESLDLDNTPSVLDTTFPLPVDAAQGIHRMRIGTADSGQATPNPCYSGSYGVTVDLTVDISGPVTWTGTEWVNGSPSPEISVLINGNLNVGTDAPGLEVSDLTVSETGSVSIPAGSALIVNGAITNNAGAASFVVESDGNLIQNGTAANTGNITVKRNSNPMIRLDYTLWSSPVISQNLFGFSPETVNGVTNYPDSPGRIYIYDGANGYVNPDPFTADAIMDNGIGYLFRAPNNWSATEEAPYEGEFIGVPFNGDKTVNTYSGNYTSVGNPYPSNLSISSLYAANGDINTLYFWNNNHNAGNNYATCTNGGGCVAAAGGGGTPNGVISAGQGFIIETDAASITFNNSMRVDGSGSFFKADELESHRMWLNLNGANDERYNQILVGYIDEATNGVDLQIDGKMFDYNGSALYNMIDEQKFVIQGRALPFEVSDVVPLGFRAAQAGKFYISLANLDGLFAEGEATIYLKDNSMNIVHNLMESDYMFESVAGEFKNRFEIVYQAEEGTMGIDDLTANGIMIYKNAESIEVSSINSNIVSVDVFDLQGRRLFSESNIHNKIFQIKSDRFATQVLIVKVKTENGVLTNKKIVNN